MTDLIFLLLIFFMITSTMVSPNAIKVLLPQGSEQTSAKPMARVIIDKDLNYYGAFGNEDEMPLALDEVPSFLQECAAKEPEMYVALYADESIPHRESRLNFAENNLKLLLDALRNGDFEHHSEFDFLSRKFFVSVTFNFSVGAKRAIRHDKEFSNEEDKERM
jgi:biopolymer transport protein ExbD